MNLLKIENHEFDGKKNGKGGDENLKRILFCVA